ncbi:Ral GTPase-activating protein subunit alpha-2 [Quaeritorhiza haematococci]|nr:Ral GTPase-activating protein subunit alpha-2 [Quaeritorhiza haematococci]
MCTIKVDHSPLIANPNQQTSWYESLELIEDVLQNLVLLASAAVASTENGIMAAAYQQLVDPGLDIGAGATSSMDDSQEDGQQEGGDQVGGLHPVSKKDAVDENHSASTSAASNTTTGTSTTSKLKSRWGSKRSTSGPGVLGGGSAFGSKRTGSSSGVAGDESGKTKVGIGKSKRGPKKGSSSNGTSGRSYSSNAAIGGGGFTGPVVVGSLNGAAASDTGGNENGNSQGGASTLSGSSLQQQQQQSRPSVNSSNTSHADNNSNGVGMGTGNATRLATYQAVVYMWDLFKRCYLRVLFPSLARRLGMSGGLLSAAVTPVAAGATFGTSAASIPAPGATSLEVEGGGGGASGAGFGFETCPPQVLHVLILFLMKFVVGEGGLGGDGSPTPAVTIMVDCADGRRQEKGTTETTGSTTGAVSNNNTTTGSNSNIKSHPSSPQISQYPALSSQALAESMMTAAASGQGIVGIFRALLLGSHENREFVHEMLRQSLLLPYMWSDVSRGAVHILRSWICVPVTDRPSFLRSQTSPASGASNSPEVHQQQQGAASTPPGGAGGGGLFSSVEKTTAAASIGATSAMTTISPQYQMHMQTQHLDPSTYLRRYIRYLRMVFLTRKDQIEYMDSQILLLKEVLTLYRSLICEPHEPLDRRTWATLCFTLLDIQEQTMCLYPNKYAVIHSPSFADDMVDTIVETVLGAWVRCGVSEAGWSRLKESPMKRDAEEGERDERDGTPGGRGQVENLENDDEEGLRRSWKMLRQQMVRSMRWSQTVVQWEKMMYKLTKILCIHVYGIDLENAMLHHDGMGDGTGSGGGKAGRHHHRGHGTHSAKLRHHQHHRPQTVGPGTVIGVAGGMNANSSGNSGETGNGGLVRGNTLHRSIGILGGNGESGSSSNMNNEISSSRVTSTKGDSGVISGSWNDAVGGGAPGSSATTSPLMDGRRQFSVDDDARSISSSSTSATGGVSGWGFGKSGSGSGSEAQRERGASKDDDITKVPEVLMISHLLKEMRSYSTLSLTGENASASENSNLTRIKVPTQLIMQVQRFAADFANITTATRWNSEKALFMWNNMLCLLGDVNEIQSTSIHAEAITCLVNVWDTLDKVHIAPTSKY